MKIYCINIIKCLAVPETRSVVKSINSLRLLSCLASLSYRCYSNQCCFLLLYCNILTFDIHLRLTIAGGPAFGFLHTGGFPWVNTSLQGASEAFSIITQGSESILLLSKHRQYPAAAEGLWSLCWRAQWSPSCWSVVFKWAASSLLGSRCLSTLDYHANMHTFDR